MITEVRAVDTPVGAGRPLRILLAVGPVANDEIRILLGPNLTKSFGGLFPCHGTMDLIVELLRIQLHPDKLFDPADDGKGIEFREIQIEVEFGGDSGFHGRRDHNRSEQ